MFKEEIPPQGRQVPRFFLQGIRPMRTAQFARPISLLPAVTDRLAEPVDPPSQPFDDQSTVALIELILKNPQHVERLLRNESRQLQLIPRFLAISLLGFMVFGIAATVLLNAAVAFGTAEAWPRGIPASHWRDATVLNLTLAYSIGLVLATGFCLPSFYFYGLLAGVKPTMLGVLAHAMKGKTVAAITLVGILPIYVAVVLGMIVFDLPANWTEATLYGALLLPFVAGLNGVRSLYAGFMALTDSVPPEQRCSRACLLRRLVVAWSACYTAITPLMVYTIWNHLS
jgi:hypothetical protein